MNHTATDPRRKPMGSPMMPGAYSGPSPDGERSDKFPEGAINNGKYRDTGCKLRPECLVCDLPECIEDTRLLAPDRREARNADIRRMFKRRVPVAEIASKHGVAARTVSRITSKKERVR